jgi:hypothetical protein
LVGVQVVELNKEAAGTDASDMNESEVADLFGKTKGFKAATTIDIADPPNVEEEDF